MSTLPHAVTQLRSCVHREMGPGSHCLSHSSPVLYKPYSFCGRKAPWKKMQCLIYTNSYLPLAVAHKCNAFAFLFYWHSGSVSVSTGMSVEVLWTTEKRLPVSLKPVLNWANVCSPNILRTVRRTMIRFLIELLVRRTWFGQSKLYFILKWLVMKCKLWPKLAADVQQTAWSKKEARVKSSQYTFIIPHRVLQLTTISFWVSETRLHLSQVNK